MLPGLDMLSGRLSAGLAADAPEAYQGVEAKEGPDELFPKGGGGEGEAGGDEGEAEPERP